MACYTKYLFLLAALALRLAPSWGQAGSGGTDTLCVASPIGNYHVQGLPGSTFTWDTQSNGTITGQGNDSIQVTWNAVGGTFQLSVTETSADGCSGTPQLISILLVEPVITITASPECAPGLLTYFFSVVVNGGILTSSAGIVENTSGNTWSVSQVPAGTNAQLNLIYNACSTALEIIAPDCACAGVIPPESSGDYSYCVGAPVPAISASVADGLTIDWYSLAFGGVLLAADTFSFTPDGPGSYFAQARDTTTDCTSLVRTAITVSEIPLPVIHITHSPDSVCPGGTIQLVATGGVFYQWSPPDGLSLADNDTTVATVNDEISYVVRGSDGQCSAKDSVTLYLRASPSIAVNPAAAGICEGDSVLLTATGAGNYTWSAAGVVICDNCETYNASPISPTVYEVVGNINGCADTSEVTVQVSQQISASIIGDTAVCENEPVSLQAAGGNTYLWNSGDTTQTVEIPQVESGFVYVVANAGYCSDTAFHFILVNAAPVLTVSDDTTINLGTEAHLHATGGSTYAWNPATDLSCTTCEDPFAAPLESTTYCVTGTNNAGCFDTACVLVKVEIVCDDFFVPNVFAPGNAGHEANDCFRVYGINCVQELHLDIYDRWGERVFSTNEPRDCWDGTFRGKDLNSGVFVYNVDVVFLNGSKIHKTGNITLIR